MIHPLDWSINSIIEKIIYHRNGEILSKEDRLYYSTLDVNNKIVLDIGASNGDSAKFFLKRGAIKVICIELQSHLAEQIKDKRCVIINKPFSLEMLNIYHDCIKCDIEGYEEILLKFNANQLKPTIIEIHGQQLIDKFIEKGWNLLTKENKIGCLGFMCNYKT